MKDEDGDENVDQVYPFERLRFVGQNEFNTNLTSQHHQMIL